MGMNITDISKSEQEDMIASFWMMLQECEGKAHNNKDVVLKRWVEGWYEQWNRVTGDMQMPIWKMLERT